MRLLWRVYFSFLASMLLALAAAAWYTTRSLHEFHQGQVATDLLSRANVLANELSSFIPGEETAPVDARCKEFGRLTQTRVTVTLPDGTVIGDSERDPALMEDHSDRPEIIRALDGGTGRSVRFSDTMRRSLMYVAVPLRRGGAVAAVVRASMPLAEIDRTLGAVYRNILAGGLLVAGIFGLAALFLAKRISKPLENMRETAGRLAGGDLAARAAVPRGKEMAALATTLNRMAEQLGDRIEAITRQAEEQRAVFASMAEGVMAVDGEFRVLHLNPAASRFLGAPADRAKGRSIQETVRNLDFQKFIAATLSADGPTEAEITVSGEEEVFLQLRGAALKDARGARIGALVVLNDVTRTRRLETVRRDFVANVSHELKTPITAIKGCIETLQGTIPENMADERRFVAMMDRHTERLGTIVDDLLSLSRIEHDVEHRRMQIESGGVSEVLSRAAQAHAAAAAARRINISIRCPERLSALMNAPLLEQAIGNLVDNAVKYSEPGTAVRIGAAPAGDQVEISVSDDGPGIESRHLSRIFERFYRVDQARSRSLGGSGLGLSIVKNIAIAHGGSVSVDSTPGKGSTFRIRIRASVSPR